MAIVDPRLSFRANNLQPFKPENKNVTRPEIKSNSTAELIKASPENLKAYFMPAFAAGKKNSVSTVDRIIKAMTNKEVTNFKVNANISGDYFTITLSFDCKDETFKINYDAKYNSESNKLEKYSPATVLIMNNKTNKEEYLSITGDEVDKIMERIVIKI